VKIRRILRKVKRLVTRLDMALRVGSWKIRPTGGMIDPKKDPYYIPPGRRGK